MPVWIIAKPRLRFADAIDSLFQKMFSLADRGIFVIKPNYVLGRTNVNHDDLFSDLMSPDTTTLNKVRSEFRNIIRSQIENDPFIPLVTNRLLTPILPKAIELGQPLRRRLRTRLDTIFGNFPNVFDEKPNCLLMVPNSSDFLRGMRLSLMLDDGYTESHANQLAGEIMDQIAFGEYKIRESGAFNRVEKIIIPTGSSFSFLFYNIVKLQVGLNPKIPASWLIPEDSLSFYLLESMSSHTVQRQIISGRPNSRGKATISFKQIIESLSYTVKSQGYSGFADSISVDGSIDFSSIFLNDATRIDRENRGRHLWRVEEAGQ